MFYFGIHVICEIYDTYGMCEYVCMYIWINEWFISNVNEIRVEFFFAKVFVIILVLKEYCRIEAVAKTLLRF